MVGSLGICRTLPLDDGRPARYKLSEILSDSLAVRYDLKANLSRSNYKCGVKRCFAPQIPNQLEICTDLMKILMEGGWSSSTLRPMIQLQTCSCMHFGLQLGERQRCRALTDRTLRIFSQSSTKLDCHQVVCLRRTCKCTCLLQRLHHHHQHSRLRSQQAIWAGFLSYSQHHLSITD